MLFTPEEKVEGLAEQFTSAHRLAENMESSFEGIVRQSILNLTQTTITLPDEARITCNEIKDLISICPNFKAPGFDQQFNILHKHLSESALLLVTNILNKCLELCYFPKDWKIAKVVAIPKSGKDPCLVTSYRGISLLSALSKIFEKVIYRRMLEYCEESNALADVQFGFRRGHSTAHQLQRVVNIVNNAKTRGMSTAMALLDVQKAFDNVWHNGLVFKLLRLQFPSYLVKLIASYLSQRTSKVVIGNIVSSTYSNCAGVPQGSVLGPLLYNLYTSDLPTLRNHTSLSLYADDTAILYSSKNYNFLRGGLQRALDTFIGYLNDWKIRVNPSKTQTIVFTYKRNMPDDVLRRRIDPIQISNVEIPWCSVVSYLGVIIDRWLRFKSHIDHISNKTLSYLKSLYPLLKGPGLSLGNKKLVYQQIIKPALLYGSHIWKTCSAFELKRVQIIQNKFLKIIHGLPMQYHTIQLHQLAEIPYIKEQIEADYTRLRTTSLASSMANTNGLFN